jgi:GNAT superfamily N-acetyltransferase
MAATGQKLVVRLASEQDREVIYRMRHRVYAEELGQHARNPDGRLRDTLDDSNHYIVVARDTHLIGFVSVTAPEGGCYSIDKYLPRERLPFPLGDDLYEVRILTVDPRHRRGPVAALLMYAALRWVEAQGGRRIMAMGRSELRALYGKVGLRGLGIPIRSGAVSFELMLASVADGRRSAEREFAAALDRLRPRVEWRLPSPFQPPAACLHGGRPSRRWATSSSGSTGAGRSSTPTCSTPGPPRHPAWRRPCGGTSRGCCGRHRRCNHTG